MKLSFSQSWLIYDILNGLIIDLLLYGGDDVLETFFNYQKWHPNLLPTHTENTPNFFSNEQLLRNNKFSTDKGDDK